MAKTQKYSEADYLYASAYIRSVEDRGLSRALVLNMLEAPDAELSLSVLFEARSQLGAGADTDDPEELCDELVNDSFRIVSEVTKNPSVFDFMRYQYDCNNIKTALKCHAKCIGTEGLLFSCGTVPPEAYARMTEEDDYSPLPDELANAAKAAAEAYKRTGDPQAIDLPLDLACLSAMKASAENTGEALLRGAVSLRVDIANVLAVIRVLRMGTVTRGELLERAISPLGSIPKKTLIEASGEGEESFFAAVADKLPRELGEKLAPGASLSEIETAADNAYIAYVSAAKNTVFGVSVPFIYLTEREYNAKNARIILAGKRAGLPYDEIRLRVRGLL